MHLDNCLHTSTQPNLKLGPNNRRINHRYQHTSTTDTNCHTHLNTPQTHCKQVQSGGNFDIDYEVLGPKQDVVLSGFAERQGDYVFAAKEKGEYTFCFSNIQSTFAEKIIDFDITVEHEIPANNGNTGGDNKNNNNNNAGSAQSQQAKIDKAKEEMRPMEDTLSRISNSLSNFQRDQRYFRTRENRNFDTVKSTENRIFWFSLTQSGVMVLTAILQVFIIQTFFSKSSGRGRV
jgi:hypothetical protein